MINKAKLTINQNRSIREALESIEANTAGVVMGVDDKERLVGIASDGDIRRFLLKNGSLDDPIAMCLNLDCYCADAATSRETILKYLDRGFKIVPLVNKRKEIIEVFSAKYLPLMGKRMPIIRAQAPVRLSFGGGGSDLTKHFIGNQGFVLNSSVSLYSHATLITNPSAEINIQSEDLNASISFKSFDDLCAYNPEYCDFSLIIAVLKIIEPTVGFTLVLRSDYPIKTGLGGSATISAAIIGCFNLLYGQRWTDHEVAEIAFQAERLSLGIRGGWQDQYASVVGGVNLMQFGDGDNLIHPLRLKPQSLLELESNLLLCFTGTNHNSGEIHDHTDKNLEAIQQSAQIAQIMYKALLKGDFSEFGRLLDKAWTLKRLQNTKISNKKLDDIYKMAINNGAVGGKLMGAGGGGYFAFFVKPENRMKLATALMKNKMQLIPFKFDSEGLTTWIVN